MAFANLHNCTKTKHMSPLHPYCVFNDGEIRNMMHPTGTDGDMTRIVEGTDEEVTVKISQENASEMKKKNEKKESSEMK